MASGAREAVKEASDGSVSSQSLERKVKAILGEFATTSDMREASGYVSEEVPEPSRPGFVSAVMPHVLELRPDQRLAPLGLLE